MLFRITGRLGAFSLASGKLGRRWPVVSTALATPLSTVMATADPMETRVFRICRLWLELAV